MARPNPFIPAMHTSGGRRRLMIVSRLSRLFRFYLSETGRAGILPSLRVARAARFRGRGRGRKSINHTINHSPLCASASLRYIHHSPLTTHSPPPLTTHSSNRMIRSMAGERMASCLVVHQAEAVAVVRCAQVVPDAVGQSVLLEQEMTSRIQFSRYSMRQWRMVPNSPHQRILSGCAAAKSKAYYMLA